MKRFLFVGVVVLATIAATMTTSRYSALTAFADETSTQSSSVASDTATDQAVDRARNTVQLLDNVFKQTIVLVTDKYVNDESDFAAGSAAVLLFKNISESGDNKVRLIDATGDPYDTDNVAKDEFEKSGIKKLKAGAKTHEQIVKIDGKPYLRAITPVPVVMEKCIMCHAHYADAKTGEPIGAISYTVPIQ